MSELSFRTKTGRCVIHPDRLELERSGPRGALAGAIFGASVTRARIFYGVLVIVLLGLTVIDLLERELGQAIMFAIVAAFLARGIVKSRGLSAAPVLQRAAITRIEAKPPVPPMARGHFIVHFTENGQPLRRLVILPGTLEGGSAEYSRALELLKSEGLPVA